jgi:hypothetical protein
VHSLEQEIIDEKYIILYHGVKNNQSFNEIFRTTSLKLRLPWFKREKP